MSLKTIIDELIDLNIHIDVEGTELKVSGAKENITLEIINKIRNNKQALIEHLRLMKKDGHLVSTIPLVSKDNSYVLSSSQFRLWVLSQQDGGSTAYNMSGAYVFEGSLNQQAFEQSFLFLLQRHESLRTVFREDEKGEPRQFIRSVEQSGFAIECEDLRLNSNRGIKISERISEEFTIPFDLSEGPLIRASLLHISEKKWLFICTMHHIISDGWSLDILMNELMMFYTAGIKGESSPLPSLRIQYKDYAAWQQAQLKEEYFQKHKAYWLNQFEGQLPILELTGDYTRPALKTFKGEKVKRRISSGLVSEIKSIAQAQGATLFMGLLAGVNTLLYRYTRQEDLIIGSPTAGREHFDLRDQIGFYVNTLALRTRFSGKNTYKQLLGLVKQVTLEAYEHQALPFDELIDMLHIQNDRSRNPLFDVMVSIQNTGTSKLKSLKLGDDVIVKEYEDTKHQRSMFDLVFNFEELEDELDLSIVYNSDIYKRSTVERMTLHFEQLLNAIVEKTEQTINELDFLNRNERDQLLTIFNKPVIPNNSVTVVDLFEAQAHRTPHETAVICNDKKISYAELNERANFLSDYLKKNYTVQPNELVGVKLERSEWMIVAMLGILKSGGVYLPIDPGYPEDRISYLLTDSRCKVLIDEKELQVFMKDAHLYKPENPVNVIHSTQLAYVIYTSGSTGQPKGVQVTHGNLSHFLINVQKNYTGNSKIIQPFVASNAFDISMFQLFTPLISGGVSVIISKEELQNMQVFSEILKNVTVIDTVPAVYQALLAHIVQYGLSDSFKNIQQVFIGGDVIPDSLLQQLSTIFHSARVIVTYGPTEGTIFCTHLVYSSGVNRSDLKGTIIGRPLDNVQIYILDETGQLVPVGISGEIHIGGAGVTKGYLNKEELTSERFIPNPFLKGERIYKTGDLGRWLENGTIEFIGRNDSQVKVRGFRIELGEVSERIKTHPEISDAIALAKKDEHHENSLIGFFIKNKPVQVWPSISEYLGYNELAYYAMNDDVLRAGSYKRAIYERVKDKVVVDVGTGPEAILAQHCIAAGAKKVYAIEILEEIYEKAKQKISSLGLQDKIILILGNVMDIELPEKVDYCVCALVGNMGSSDGCIPIMNSAKRFLKDSSCMIPYRSVTKIAAIHLPKDNTCYEFTESGSYYLNSIFSNAGKVFDMRMALQNVSEEHLISTEGIFEDLDLTQLLPLNNENTIELDITSDSEMNGFLIWLNLYTTPDILNDIFKSQKSFLPVYFPVFDAGIPVKKGDRIRAKVWVETGTNEIYPDYGVRGEVLQTNGTRHSFDYVSRRLPDSHAQNGFYGKVLKNGKWKTKPAFSKQELQDYLRNTLPEYMIPPVLEERESFPLTSNGKIDRKALLESIEAGSAVEYVSPRNEIEEKLIRIWQEVLGKNKKVGVKNNFFESGGHSLKATRLAGLIYKEFEVKLELKDLFANPVLEGQAARIAQAAKTAFISIPQIHSDNGYALSYSQRGLWLLSQYKEGSIAYNMPGAYVVEGDLDLQQVQNVFKELIARHESLRTVFREDEKGEIRQFILLPEEIDFSMDVQDLRHMKDAGTHVNDKIDGYVSTPFEFTKAPLLRVALFRTADHQSVLVYVMHHIISDGWSMGVFIREFFLLYNALVKGERRSLAPLRIQYKDYTAWQNIKLSGDQLNRLLNYWHNRLGNQVSLLNLPVDYPRPEIQSFAGETHAFELSPELSVDVLKRARNANITAFSFLLAAYNAFLYKLTSQDTIILGTTLAGRGHRDLESLIGVFINTIAVKTVIEPSQSFAFLAEQTHQHLLNDIEHDLPFELLVKNLDIRRDRSTTPVFQSRFVFDEFDEKNNSHSSNDLLFKELKFEWKSAKFDLSTYLYKFGNKLTVSMEYRSDLFKQSTIQRFGKQFITILENIVKDPGKRIMDLQILSEEDKQELIGKKEEKARKRLSMLKK